MKERLTALFIGFELYQLVMVGWKLKILMIAPVAVFFLHVTVIQRLLRCNMTALLTQLVSCKPVHVSSLEQTKGAWCTVVFWLCFAIYWLFCMFSSCHFFIIGFISYWLPVTNVQRGKKWGKKWIEISPEEISLPYFERLEKLHQLKKGRWWSQSSRIRRLKSRRRLYPNTAPRKQLLKSWSSIMKVTGHRNLQLCLSGPKNDEQRQLWEWRMIIAVNFPI